MSKTIDAQELRKLTPWPALIDALEHAFRHPCSMPPRLHYEIHVAEKSAGALLVMPAWVNGGLLGVKLVQAFPRNSDQHMPTIHGIYMLASATSGEVLALIDGQELTARRTAAASALAAKYLARSSSSHLLIMGTGRLALNFVHAHAAVRPIERVSIWGRAIERAKAVATQVRCELGLDAVAVENLREVVSQADIISTVTAANSPILEGHLLKTGAHVDLVGSYTPLMREADDDVIRRASVYVDNLAAAPRESGDISIPVDQGVIAVSDIVGDLFGLCCGIVRGRTSDEAITVFKSVGIALEDLAAGTLAWNTLQAR